ncbi:EamA family transporter [Actinoplanes sp. NPDC051513]|uniref:EamA family transporter n=1 Tax=Actinoplanes sp. NPDC051513 TaxID=3363908 RepID=UPI00378B84CA
MSPGRVPPQAFFAVSAVFHYLGPAFAVTLFGQLGVPGVTWIRIAGAAAVFAVWRRPWRPAGPWRPLVALGAVLAAMNTVFYLACARIPLSTVGAIEFLGIIVLAAVGVRGRRNLLALALAVGGVVALADVRIVAEPLGIVLAFANCALFLLYVVLGHRIANAGPGSGGTGPGGIDRLGAAMLVAAVIVTPYGLGDAAVAFTHPLLLLAGFGVAVCSSVIPYVTDQLAMARLGRSSFALMLSILPATATVVGLVVLAQVPTAQDVMGIALITAGVAIHQAEAPRKVKAPCAT